MFIAFGLAAAEDKQPKHETDLSELPFIYFGVVILLMAFVAGGGYLLGRSYAAEYYFKKAANGLMKNNAKEVYDNMKKARVLNPNEERFVLNFSQTNLLVADALARKDADQITESDRQTIAQAVQAAISEAKELIRLNPNRASSFENLANVYKNIIPLAAGADVWTISSYQRAIVLDPANPSYRLNLGGVYYLLGRYGEAARLFEQAASLKTDWPNAYYNLAWAYFQGQKYDLAATAMQNVVNLIDKKTSPQDWEKANKDLTDFKNKLVSSQNEATAEGQLNLPQQTINELDPKLKLPPEASPEAK
jgi:tetratricopeptide (TPR) repeat protein